jgi:large subunit ribosomal protein L1
MREKDAVEALKKVREISKPRKFVQSVEMMINFTGLDMKKPQNQVNLRVVLPNSVGKSSGKIVVFVKTDEFAKNIKDRVDLIISEKEIEVLAKDKKKFAELLEFDSLFAEGPAMLTVAKFLGQQLVPKGKMPKPILNVKNFDEVLSKTKTEITVSNKKGKFMPVVHTLVGKENIDDKLIIENMMAVYNAVLESLPQKKQNVKSVFIKMTMGKPVKIGDVQ